MEKLMVFILFIAALLVAVYVFVIGLAAVSGLVSGLGL